MSRAELAAAMVLVGVLVIWYLEQRDIRSTVNDSASGSVSTSTNESSGGAP